LKKTKNNFDQAVDLLLDEKDQEKEKDPKSRRIDESWV